jgi:hypothetical protein
MHSSSLWFAWLDFIILCLAFDPLSLTLSLARLFPFSILRIVA